MSAPNVLTKLLAIRHPVLLAPMAGISGGMLAAAVSRAGGLGFWGAGYGDSQWLLQELTLCDGVPFGVGFITWALQTQPDLLCQALDAKPQAIFLSFGAVAQGAQVIVAQGGEAGGHGGLRGTMALVPAIVDAGVVCGTAFYAAEESLAHVHAKQRLVAASGDDTVKSPVFDMVRGRDWPPGPWLLRALRNRFSGQWTDAVPALQNAIVQSMVDQCNALLQRDH